MRQTQWWGEESPFILLKMQSFRVDEYWESLSLSLSLSLSVVLTLDVPHFLGVNELKEAEAN